MLFLCSNSKIQREYCYIKDIIISIRFYYFKLTFRISIFSDTLLIISSVILTSQNPKIQYADFCIVKRRYMRESKNARNVAQHSTNPFGLHNSRASVYTVRKSKNKTVVTTNESRDCSRGRSRCNEHVCSALRLVKSAVRRGKTSEVNKKVDRLAAIAAEATKYFTLTRERRVTPPPHRRGS